MPDSLRIAPWVAAFILLACNVDDDGFGLGERGAPSPTPAPLQCAPPPCTGDCALGEAVAWSVEDGEAACGEYELNACTADYLSFLDRAEAEGEPLSVDDVRAAVEGLWDGGTAYEEGPASTEELASVVRRATNVGFLLEELEARPLTVREVGRERWMRGTQVDLLLDDPWVGELSVMLLLPDGEGPFPGVVVHPGHGESARDHRDNRFGRELLQAGLALAILNPRVHSADGHESDVTEALLTAGHTFMALRIYETALLRRVLKAHPLVHPDRVGLLGHSGGSASSNLVVRLDDGWRAYASDFVTEYLYVDPGWIYLDETVPELHPWYLLLAEMDDLDTPTRIFEYGYTEGAGALAAFLCQNLTR